MLNEKEEQFLRRQIQENTPLQPVNPMPPPTGFVPLVPDAKIEQWKTEPKMRQVDLNKDDELQKKIKAAGFDGKPGEFYSSVGLSREQALAMSKPDLRTAIERARLRDDVPVPRASLRISPAAQPTRPRFVEVGN